MKVKSESEVAQSCPTLSVPTDHSLPGSSIQGIFQPRVLDWAAITFSIALTRWTFVGKVMSLLFNVIFNSPKKCFVVFQDKIFSILFVKFIPECFILSAIIS